MYTSVLFDLDGTLTDSKEGIIKSVEYALIQMGETTEGRLDQHIIVGPPLVTTFRDTFGFSEEKARETYAHFQQRYSTIGKFENRAFDGVVPMLQRLQERGVRSFVATSKPGMPYTKGVKGASITYQFKMNALARNAASSKGTKKPSANISSLSIRF